ncbi:MAG: hypothetical protein KDI36_10535 [Pseudomonadales bacterium]|nr:hypothetical protein [Pseudomonadales bacterium]
MPEFILRAHAASTDPQRLAASIGDESHGEYLAHCILNALLISKGHRDDTRLTLVLENSADFSRAVTLDGATLGHIGGTTEAALLQLVVRGLRAGLQLRKEESRTAEPGITVQAISFEHLVRDRLQTAPVYLLEPGGIPVRETRLSVDDVYLLSDHIPMQRKAIKSLLRIGARPLSLGPVMLHASQCITLVQNELDWQCSN